MTVAVTGASGHVGANLVRALVASGENVRCLVHVNSVAIDGLPVETVKADLRDAGSLRKAFADVDMVYHLAANISISMKDWPRVQAVNVGGVKNVVEACLGSGVRRLVHCSSIHAMQQEPLDEPLDEDRPLVPDAPSEPPYDRSKAAGEREVRRGVERGLDAVIVAPTAVIGPNDFGPSYFGQALLQIAQKKLPSLVNGGFNWVDVRDVVAGAQAAGEKGKCGAKYLLSGNWVAMPEMAAVIEEITGEACTRNSVPLWLAAFGAPFVEAWCAMRKTQPLYTRMSLSTLIKSHRDIRHDRATRDLGYEPRPFRETIADTLNWYTDAGLLCRAGAADTEATLE